MKLDQFKFFIEKTTVRVGRIGYINVAPVYYGFDHQHIPSHIKLISEPPAVLNRMMEKGDIDISPVSSAAYARNHDKWDLLPDLSISSFGKVMSVILASNQPLEKLNHRKILLSNESASAAEMLKLVLSWKKINPIFKTGTVSSLYVSNISEQSGYNDHDAVLVIGNNALTGKWEQRFPYIYDLGEMWQNMTGLPFVFAVWAVRKSFSEKHPNLVDEITACFKRSKQLGLSNLDEIQKSTSCQLGLDIDCCKSYFNQLNYNLEHMEIKGLKKFYQGLSSKKLIPGPVKLSFISQKEKNYNSTTLVGIRRKPNTYSPILFFNKKRQILLNLRSLHFPLPLKRVFPQLLHRLRQGRP